MMAERTEWYANVNDLVGGFIVANVDESLGNIEVRPGVQVIAECNTEEDAMRIAGLLNYSEEPESHGQALLFGIVGPHVDLWHNSASFHAFLQMLLLMLPQIVNHLAKYATAEAELIEAKIQDAMAGKAGNSGSA